MSVTSDDDKAVLAWTAERLLADGELAGVVSEFGSQSTLSPIRSRRFLVNLLAWGSALFPLYAEPACFR